MTIPDGTTRTPGHGAGHPLRGLALGLALAAGLAMAAAPATAAPARDSDHDGYPDTVEKAAGSDPNQRADTPADHAPYQPHILSFTPDPKAPLTRFYILLDPYADPDGDDVPTRTEWRITDPKGGTSAYRTLASTPKGAPADLMVVPPGALEPRHTYAVALRHQDITGLWSAWSPNFELKTARRDPDDTDGDGVSDRAETQTRPALPMAPAHTEFRDAEQGRGVDVEAGSGSVERLTVLRAADLPAGERPAPGTLPYGLFGLRVLAPEPGGSVSLTFHLPETLPDGARWLDVHPATGPDPRPPRAVVTGHTITVEVADGGPGDADGVANGVVVSLAGPALPETPAPLVLEPEAAPVRPAAGPPDKPQVPTEPVPATVARPGTM